MPHPMTSFTFAVPFLFGLSACGGSPPVTPTPGPNDPAAADANPSECLCDVTDNGVHKTLACGESGCVGAMSYSCSAAAVISQTGYCSPAAADSGTGTTDSGGLPDAVAADSGTTCAASQPFPCFGSTTCTLAQVCFVDPVMGASCNEVPVADQCAACSVQVADTAASAACSPGLTPTPSGTPGTGCSVTCR